MEILDIKDYTEKRFKTAIALGNFDGVHLGHKKLISTMINDAKNLVIASSLLLFRRHSKEILLRNIPNILTSAEDKCEILKEMGLNIVYEIDFTEKFMRLSPEDFVKNILIDRLNVQSVFVGINYRFGYKASGDIDVLKELSNKYNFNLNVIEPVFNKQKILSSSEIRMNIVKGNIELANEMIGRNYKIKGKVVHGNKIGRTLGFPTANIELSDRYQIPKKGVYITKTIVDGIIYKSLTNIGTNPTVGGKTIKIETHILNFNRDIYKQDLEIEFIQYYRGEMVFSTLEELKLQMQKDLNVIKL